MPKLKPGSLPHHLYGLSAEISCAKSVHLPFYKRKNNGNRQTQSKTKKLVLSYNFFHVIISVLNICMFISAFTACSSICWFEPPRSLKVSDEDSKGDIVHAIRVLFHCSTRAQGIPQLGVTWRSKWTTHRFVEGILRIQMRRVNMEAAENFLTKSHISYICCSFFYHDLLPNISGQPALSPPKQQWFFLEVLQHLGQMICMLIRFEAIAQGPGNKGFHLVKILRETPLSEWPLFTSKNKASKNRCNCYFYANCVGKQPICKWS